MRVLTVTKAPDESSADQSGGIHIRPFYSYKQILAILQIMA
jgi:hypothetical protein